MLSICISLFSPSLRFFIKTQPQSKTPLLEGGQKYGNFSVASLRPNGKNPEKILRIAYGHLIRIQKELCLYLHLPPRYGPPDYGGKSGFLWSKIHISLEEWNKFINLCSLDSPFFILSITFEPLFWKKSPIEKHRRVQLGQWSSKGPFESNFFKMPLFNPDEVHII